MQKKNIIDKALGILDDSVNKITSFASMSDSRSAGTIVSTAGYGVLSDYEVWRPEGVHGDIITNLVTLQNTLDALKEMPIKNLKPLRLWSGNFISDEDYYRKPWMELTTESVSLDNHVDKLTELRDPSNEERILMVDLYLNDGDIAKATSLIEKLVEEVADIPDGRIVNEFKKVNGVVNRVLSGDTYKERLGKVSEDNKKLLQEKLFDTAKAMELLSVVVYQTLVINEAHKRNIEKIVTDLK